MFWNLAFFSVFLTNYILIYLFPGSLVCWLAILLLAFMYVGIFEALHQTTHNCLFKSRKLNEYFGVIAGLLFGINFYAYRAFHLAHHRYTNTGKDPENALFNNKFSNFKLFFVIPFILMTLSTAMNARKDLVKGEDTKKLKKVSLMIHCFRLVILISAFVSFELVLYFYILPMFLFSYIEFLLSQSQHFHTEKLDHSNAVSAQEILASSHNLILPRAISFLLMNTNYHATHHLSPNTKWFDLPNKTNSLDATHNLSLRRFFVQWKALGMTINTQGEKDV